MSTSDSHASLAPQLPDLSVDWAAIDRLDPAPAAEAIRGILCSAEAILGEAETKLAAIRERLFNLRMVCFRIVSDRRLWELDVDPEYGVPFKSFYRWLQCLYPNDEGLRYAMEANATQKALPQASLDDLGQMKRANAVTLASKFVSDTCRNDPSVIEATKTATEREFREKLNRDHGQHLPKAVTRKWTLPEEDWKQIDSYLAWVASKADLDPEDKPGALLYLSIHELHEIEA